MTVFEFDGKLLIVDCGVLFPEDDQPGIDLILPDFDYIRQRLDDVVGLVLTHGHEDHIGAVPYLLRERADIPLFGSRLTLAFLEAKLREHRITPVTTTVAEGDRTVPPSDAGRVRQRLPGVQVHRLPGLGHLAHEEAPAAVAELLLARVLR
jgi:mRNA degradation ribonuclease J1/J2